MKKEPIRPMWTTTVDPSEYDYVKQFGTMVKKANENKECFSPMDVGKVWGLVQSHQTLERENADLRADKERLDLLDRILMSVGEIGQPQMDGTRFSGQCRVEGRYCRVSGKNLRDFADASRAKEEGAS